MGRDLDVMKDIQNEREKKVKKTSLQPLDPEGVAMAEHKRDTIDEVAIPVDPLR